MGGFQKGDLETQQLPWLCFLRQGLRGGGPCGRALKPRGRLCAPPHDCPLLGEGGARRRGASPLCFQKLRSGQGRSQLCGAGRGSGPGAGRQLVCLSVTPFHWGLCKTPGIGSVPPPSLSQRAAAPLGLAWGDSPVDPLGPGAVPPLCCALEPLRRSLLERSQGQGWVGRGRGQERTSSPPPPPAPEAFLVSAVMGASWGGPEPSGISRAALSLALSLAGRLARPQSLLPAPGVCRCLSRGCSHEAGPAASAAAAAL